MSSAVHRVLFVCLGNICRSPSAEGAFRKLVTERGLAARFGIDSAGTGDWHLGAAPDPRAVDAAARRGIDLSALCARQVTKNDFVNFDWLIAMDDANHATLLRLAGARHRHKVRYFVESTDASEREVPDPYYGEARDFDTALDLIERAAADLLDHLLAREATDTRIEIDISDQCLALHDHAGSGAATHYPVSTAANGTGEIMHSHCTPRGRHLIRAKIGGGAPLGAVFVARRPSGEVFTPALRAAAPDRDWILTRILWLSGCQPGFNRLGAVDSMRRFIYIHGTPDDITLGHPGSHGCIRMRNRDVVELFDRVPLGTPVNIVA